MRPYINHSFIQFFFGNLHNIFILNYVVKQFTLCRVAVYSMSCSILHYHL